jgi:hypothetical protein
VKIEELEEKLQQVETDSSSEKLRVKMAEGMASVTNYNVRFLAQTLLFFLFADLIPLSLFFRMKLRCEKVK